ncbi:tellurium resistance protein [Thioclava sp.]|uniref:SLAC1 family transporter n=1 Tax=Thioclava sp. TaxID=1933450 RepID=UPI003AA7E464
MSFAPAKPTPKGLFRRTPPAAFPPILGLMGLGTAWRRGVDQFALPPALAEALLGGVTLLAIFALVAYAVKFLRRPGVLHEDFRILPGRAGLAAIVLSQYLVAVALAPCSNVASVIFLGTIALHLVFNIFVIIDLLRGPAEQRRVTPVWQLIFTGWIVGAVAAQSLGFAAIAIWLFWASLISALCIWAISLQQFSRESVPAPLRPLLAIHLAPAALIGTAGATYNAEGIAQVMALLSAGYLIALVVSARWLLASGFTPLWGALTFPLAATAGCWLAVGGIWALPGALLLVVATVVIIPIAIKVIQLWMKGQLALKTNAAIA